MTEKILLVEDDKSFAGRLSEQLQEKGFDVVSASTVQQATALISSQLFDALITDTQLGRRNDGGFFVERLFTRKNPGKPIVAMSSVQQPLWEAGINCNAFFLKHDQIPQFADDIAAVLRMR